MLEGFVIGFDFKGRRLWDYSIPMDELKVQGRDQVSDFTVVNDVPQFLYKSDNELKFSNHGTDTIRVAAPQPIPIKLNDQFEESKSNDENEGNVRHWYGPFFYVWGIQTVKDLNHRDQTRRVFFINKIQVE